MRLDSVLGEELAHRPLRQFGQAVVTGGWPSITRVCGQQSCRPQLVRIPSSFGFWQASATSQVLASGVMVGSRPARGRSSKALITPNSAARPRHRATVCAVTLTVRATA